MVTDVRGMLNVHVQMKFDDKGMNN